MSSPLNAKQEQAAILLSTGLSGSAVAMQVGITAETISRWKLSPDFLAAINAHQKERVSVAREKLRELAQKAVSTIDGLMDSKSEGIRLKAAVSLLKLTNMDTPSQMFSGIGPDNAIDILLDMQLQVQAEQFQHKRQYDFIGTD